MRLNRVARRLAGVLLVAASSAGALTQIGRAADRLPGRLSDREFWNIIVDLSEPGGSFRSDNLLSNEIGFPYVLPDLIKTTRPASVYMGVGPEQNFSYIAAIQPKVAFIVDIRRGNRDLHLMYKALFELSADRAEFVSRLFSRPRSEGLTARSTPLEIFAAYGSAESSDALYKENLKAIQDVLVSGHQLPLSPEDLQGIEYVYRAFYTFGPAIQYSSNMGGFGALPSYAQLMTATDDNGQPHSYLSTEESFQFLKQLQSKNLLLPIVGNFSGPKAIRGVGTYLRDHDAVVSAFYLSNVEMYLGRDGSADFCGNVATLPLDGTSTFIRSLRSGRLGPGNAMTLDLASMAAEVKDCSTLLR